MLIDFSFSNYRSFHEEQSFSMTRDARFDVSEHNGLSTIAAVYGANASGKTNFLRAFAEMCDMVRSSYSRGDATTGVPRTPFLLSEDAPEADSMFFAEFLGSDAQKYRYWFRFDDHAILEEELTVYKRLKDRLSTHSTRLFSRSSEGVDFGPSFRGPRAQVRKTVELRPNALVLSAAAAAGIACIQPAFDFFASRVTLCEASAFESEQPFILHEFARGTEFSHHLATLIRYADFGIENVQSVSVNMPLSVLETVKQQFREQLGAQDDKIDRLFNVGPQEQLRFNHIGKDVTAALSMEEESRGTLAALSFFSLALRQLSRCTVTLIDEIDASLHPNLVRELIALFTDKETNPYGAQLIFTTHDASLITASGSTERLIDPDQVWLVDKTDSGASEIYPVTDIGVRKEENIGKNYLNGVYGAVPRPSFHAAFAQIIHETGSDQ